MPKMLHASERFVRFVNQTNHPVRRQHPLLPGGEIYLRPYEVSQMPANAWHALFRVSAFRRATEADVQRWRQILQAEVLGPMGEPAKEEEIPPFAPPAPDPDDEPEAAPIAKAKKPKKG